MSVKRKSMTSPGGSAKKQRKAIDLEMKMKIINDYEAGKKVKAIARDLELARLTISMILKDKDRVKEAVQASTGFKAIITRQWKGLIHEMEKLLVIWFDDQIQKRMPMSLLIIQAKARSIFETLKAREGEESTETFTASHGWFQWFRRRFNVHNRNISSEAASADVEAAEKFVDQFDEIIEKGGYRPEQIFNVDETGLFWKKMPERSYIHKEAKAMPGFKAFKDRVMLLLGGNVAGFKLKPFLIHRSENPRALKQVSKHTLPVYYRANSKPWMTQALFEDWFINCFIPSVKHYCLEKGVPFKIILLLDNAPGHPQHLDDLHPDVKVVYLPKNTTAILQPMDQGAIATFKVYYLRTTFSKAVAATESDEVTLCDFWKSYNILHCIKNIESAWEGVTEKCMQGIWKKCLKVFVNNFEGFDKDDHVNVINKKIVELANVLNLDVEVKDIEELVEYVEGELTNEDLIELEAQQHLEEEEEEEEEERMEEVQKKLTVNGLADAFSKVNAAILELEGMDPNVERFTKVEWQMNELLRCYCEIYEEKKKITKITKQTTLTGFFSKATPRTSADNSDDNFDD
ncbi:tigger transposable element-derived protein 1-like [Alligator mississippiensis]|uniref:tigger transposable element-derived protein 1-like n=1 Tax=Alligator mississippiensis TaxID=8496 RepID=UPI002877AFC6|nr:tigger transposable element-derived protein 1-like [Alligator mississippiensis]